ncbi:hypothetical protein [Paraburkholderia sp. J11-2]|uniref:hypothetical protein n=1 Tax=Paraburkholderia sp. J11-2 TaxID=2805431 RepID=UPI002AB6EE40|nr:hypothetical protein [Paraburkholderia sp. J11-2]
MEQRQAREANAKKRAEESEAIAPRRRILTVRKGWAARKAIEALFNFAPEPVLASGQGIPRNVGLTGDAGKNSE